VLADREAAIMKVIVVHKYRGPEELIYEEFRDPVAGAGQELVRTAATIVNPIEIKRRSGMTKEFLPIKFPGLSAWTSREQSLRLVRE
jgi:NADPH:quinone reductase-like Zn-dependent oxidoreductase